MSDAIRDTPPRATSKQPASHDDEGHSSNGGDSEVDTSFGASDDVVGSVKDAVHGEQSCKTDGKQKRKRTRYVNGLWAFTDIVSSLSVEEDCLVISWVSVNYNSLTMCSPKDQAILEAEYKQNPKPNKAARADIVGKVSLNEKEVQVSCISTDVLLCICYASWRYVLSSH
jgi:hypothetical protein